MGRNGFKFGSKMKMKNEKYKQNKQTCTIVNQPEWNNFALHGSK